MILIDMSSVLHRMIFGSTKDLSKIRVEDGKYITEDFVFLTMHYILEEIISCQLKYREYGEVVLCFDDYKKDYWRKDVYPYYKTGRKESREASPINYPEVFSYTNELFDQLQNNTPWRCLFVNRAEADDIILVLAKEFHHQGVIICSPDKDFIQAQRYPNIKQYSALTKKWIVPETKHGDMEHWINEHVILGDAADGVPKVTDYTEFSDIFKEHILKFKDITDKYILDNALKERINDKDVIIDITKVHNFYRLSKELQDFIIADYEEKTFNRKGQETGYDVFNNKKFGPKKLEKIMEDDINKFLDSHPLYRPNYERNYTLVMEEGIPEYIRKIIMMEYNTANMKYNEEEFCQYLDRVNLRNIKSALPKVFQSTETLDITNCGW